MPAEGEPRRGPSCGLGRCDRVAVGLVAVRPIRDVQTGTQVGPYVLPLCPRHLRLPLADADLVKPA